ncbi:hypothetical protein [Mesorhizobium sp.]|uniref:hypothetical protein n=1 Tax=Mesorhizobium sp. TaxID=1871066 RepID=UPI000FE543F0|nr:hypothetical protein [Mesorhizobium sp.]RWC33236.1 MAG: hypothetical protein EOS27_05280 [Mesorhizobium sp.]TIX25347.1 MAG: hypothetical protein E5V35_14740 [Mesorhizobium sp.]
MQIKIDPILLDNSDLSLAGVFHATTGAHGLYNTFQFVLRLSPEVHRRLGNLSEGISDGATLDFETVQAASTYLHETVHWWQHVGSTYGLMLSLSFPSQMQTNYDHLKQFIVELGFKKSIRRVVERSDGASGYGTPLGNASRILNNHYDISAYRNLTVSPRSASAVVNSPLFESVGHAYEIAIGNNALLLAATADPDFQVINHPKDWEEGFRRLRNDKEQGFYFGSPVELPPVGAYEIFEGQARFAQLQFLHFATGGQFELSHAAKFGMLKPPYGEAFETFLKLTELPRPGSIDHPTVGLFLLVCDLAINPGSGFPFPLIHYPTFITDQDPGHRFLHLSRIIRLKCPNTATAIRNYSRAEYEAISTELTTALLEFPPLAIAELVTKWPERSAPIKTLMDEHATFDFSLGNIVPRFMLAHFIAFARDKLKSPEFFCWPGAWMAGSRVSNEIAALHDRHSAPFIDKADDDGIFPRLYTDRNQDNVQKTFDAFYASVVIYDMTHQWITEPAPFKYHYRWLSREGDYQALKAFVDRQFEGAFGVHPDEVELVG